MTTKAIDKAVAEDGGKGAPREPSAVFALAMILAALAGFVDATGYIHFHHLFVSFMSGNSTQAMVAAARDDMPEFVVIGRTIALFVVGVTVGETVGEVSMRWGRSAVLMLETVLLGAALASLRLRWGEGWTSAALALAMGVQNAAVHKAEGISVALTYVTGTLVHVGRGISKALRGYAPWHAVLPFVGLWVGLVSGGFVGALIAGRSLALALLVAAGASLVLAMWPLASAVIAPEGEPG